MSEATPAAAPRGPNGGLGVARAALLLSCVAVGVWVVHVEVQRPQRQSLLNIDMLHQFYPNARFQHTELRAGRMPLWNPYQMAGEPFLAIHYPGSVYPVQLALMGLGPPEHTLALHTIFHWTLAGLFTWLLARRLGARGPPALAAAVVYMLCGRLVFGAYSPFSMGTLAWFPGLLWALDGLVCEARLRWGVGLGVIGALAFLAGYAQALLWGSVLLTAYGVAGLVFRAHGHRLRVLGLAVVAGLVAFGLVAPQLLPSLELTSQSVRGFSGSPLEVATYPSASASLVGRGLLGLLGERLLEPIPVRWGPRYAAQPLFDAATVPLLTLPLLVFGAFARRSRAAWIFFSVWGVLLGVFLVGVDGPVFPLFHALPLGNLFRGPMRADFLYVLSAALLCAIGLEGVRTLLEQRGVAAKRVGQVVLGLSLAVAAGTLLRVRLPDAVPSVVPPNLGAPPPLVEALRSRAGRIFLEQPQRVDERRILVKAGQMNGLPVVPDYEPSLPSRYERYFGLDLSLPWHGALSVYQAFHRGEGEALLRRLDLMSVRWYVFAEPVPQRFAASQRKHFVGGSRRVAGFRVMERREALPRAYVVSEALPAADVEAAIAAALAPEFDARRQVVVTAPEGAAWSTAPGELTGSAKVVEERSDRVEIEASCDEPCWLVLTDFDYPGWEARADGESVLVHPANGVFRAVRLGAGSHRVVYEFRPASLRRGFALSGVTLGALAVLGLASARRWKS